MSNFSKEIEKEISARMKMLSFKKQAYLYYKPWDDNAVLTVSFGIASFRRSGHRYVSPNIGIYYKDLGEIYNTLNEQKTKDISYVVGEGLGYLMPEKTFKEWDFVENQDNTDVYEDMFRAITTFGYQYIDEKNQYDRIMDFFKTREKAAGKYQILSILYYLHGEKSKGETVIEEELIKEIERVKEYEFPTQPSNPMSNVVFGKEVTDAERAKFEKKYMTLFTDEVMEKTKIAKQEYINANFIDSKYGRVSKDFLKFIENYKAWFGVG
jgi:hypothetical protein